MLKKVVRTLGYHPIAQIKFPDAMRMRKFTDMVNEREPLVDDIIGFMDGVSFPSECTDKRVKQNAYYNNHNCARKIPNPITTSIIVFVSIG